MPASKTPSNESKSSKAITGGEALRSVPMASRSKSATTVMGSPLCHSNQDSQFPDKCKFVLNAGPPLFKPNMHRIRVPIGDDRQRGPHRQHRVLFLPRRDGFAPVQRQILRFGRRPGCYEDSPAWCHVQSVDRFVDRLVVQGATIVFVLRAR